MNPGGTPAGVLVNPTPLHRSIGHGHFPGHSWGGGFWILMALCGAAVIFAAAALYLLSEGRAKGIPWWRPLALRRASVESLGVERTALDRAAARAYWWFWGVVVVDSVFIAAGANRLWALAMPAAGTLILNYFKAWYFKKLR